MTQSQRRIAARTQYLTNEAHLYAICEQLDHEQLTMLVQQCHAGDVQVPEEVLGALTVFAQDILRRLMASGPGRIQVARAAEREQDERKEPGIWRAEAAQS